MVKKSTKKAKRKSPAKKSVKKRAKKSTTKGATTTKKKVRAPKKHLETYNVHHVPEHQHFYFVNGKQVKNVKELAEIMDKIEQEVFDYHVNPEKNDFYNWVNDVFNDIELAKKITGAKNPEHLQLTIHKHVIDKNKKKG